MGMEWRLDYRGQKAPRARPLEPPGENNALLAVCGICTIISNAKGITTLVVPCFLTLRLITFIALTLTQFDSTGVRPGLIMQTIRQQHGGARRISGRHPSVCEPDSRPFSTGHKNVVDKQSRKTR